MRAVLPTLSALLLGAAVANAQDPIEPTAAESAQEASPPPPTSEAESARAAEATPAAAAPEAASLPAELSGAELQQLGFDSAEPAVDYGVKLSGFIDLGLAVPFGDTRGLNEKPSFAIGNLNVYLSKNLTESVRTMMEVRFLYLPNGAHTNVFTDRTLISTAVPDYTDFNRPLRWGGIEIERVYVEWATHPFLTIRAGQFLTPYGIWNVDHGTPTIIPTSRPFVIGSNFFPERQTGLELFGRWEATANSTFGYNLTLSNGGGPATEWLDLDNNKAVGGRIFWEYRKWGELRIGGSAYYGRYTDSVTPIGFVDGKIKTSEKIKQQWDSLALAADVTFKYRGIHVQAEFITQQLAFTKEGRVASFSASTFTNTYPADGFRYGGYLLLGYRFDWFGVMPFLLLQKIGGVDSSSQSEEGATPVSFGLNIRPIESLVFKVEYTQVFFPEAQQFPGFDIQLLNTQLAWAF